jgi:hypothetical protein
METVRTRFDPPIHGFRFVNRFDLADFLHFDSDQDYSALDQDNPLSRSVYGLCGGMCFAALDYFYAPKAIPRWENPDHIHYRLFSYLWRRQMDSTQLAMLGNLVSWMLWDDQTLHQKMAEEEIPRLLLELRAGRPTVLVLIHSAASGNPTDNHQVLATGFDYDSESDQLTLYLYDPNQKAVTVELNVRRTAQSDQMEILQPGSSHATRGFFVSAYHQKRPG